MSPPPIIFPYLKLTKKLRDINTFVQQMSFFKYNAELNSEFWILIWMSLTSECWLLVSIVTWVDSEEDMELLPKIFNN